MSKGWSVMLLGFAGGTLGGVAEVFGTPAEEWAVTPARVGTHVMGGLRLEHERLELVLWRVNSWTPQSGSQISEEEWAEREPQEPPTDGPDPTKVSGSALLSLVVGQINSLRAYVPGGDGWLMFARGEEGQAHALLGSAQLERGEVPAAALLRMVQKSPRLALHCAKSAATQDRAAATHSATAEQFRAIGALALPPLGEA